MSEKILPRYKEIKIVWDTNEITYLKVTVEKHDGRYWRSYERKHQLTNKEEKLIMSLAEGIALKALERNHAKR